MTTTPSRVAHEPELGARVRGDSTHFSAYASRARNCSLRLFDTQLVERSTRPMVAHGSGSFTLDVREAPHGTLYKFVLDGQEFPDPYARFLPHGVHGPAMVVEPRHGRPGDPPPTVPGRRHLEVRHFRGAGAPDGRRSGGRRPVC